jgi:hypothetical protein
VYKKSGLALRHQPELESEPMTNDSLSIVSKIIQFDIGISQFFPGEKLRDGDPRWRQHTSSFMEVRYV